MQHQDRDEMLAAFAPHEQDGRRARAVLASQPKAQLQWLHDAPVTIVMPAKLGTYEMSLAGSAVGTRLNT
jgi:hypothetical protein